MRVSLKFAIKYQKSNAVDSSDKHQSINFGYYIRHTITEFNFFW